MTHTITLILTTLPGVTLAENFSRQVLDAKLAACATQFAPVHSRYVWQGQFEDTEEIVLLFKTTPEIAPTLKEWLARHHPYDVPEILSWSASANVSYAQWVQAAVLSNPIIGTLESE